MANPYEYERIDGDRRSRKHEPLGNCEAMAGGGKYGRVEFISNVGMDQVQALEQELEHVSGVQGFRISAVQGRRIVGAIVFTPLLTAQETAAVAANIRQYLGPKTHIRYSVRLGDDFFATQEARRETCGKTSNTDMAKVLLSNDGKNPKICWSTRLPFMDEVANARWIRSRCVAIRSEIKDMPAVISSQVFRHKETGDVIGVIDLDMPTDQDLETIAVIVQIYVGIDTPIRYSIYIHRNARKRFEPAQWVMASVPDEEVAQLDEDDV